jgi:putative transposase
MARPLRTEFPGAIYHVMSRGNARQVVFRDDLDYQRIVDGLAQTVERFGWEFVSVVLMPNHWHLFLRTPRPNLSRGTQYLVSGYANWHAKCHRLPGHLFQGRFKSELIEDESYFGTVRRYVHLNPTRGKVPMAELVGCVESSTTHRIASDAHPPSANTGASS